MSSRDARLGSVSRLALLVGFLVQFFQIPMYTSHRKRYFRKISWGTYDVLIFELLSSSYE